ncbi:universal stress protein [Streptomyces sp. NPDC091209]|uniref:universal stress protein n=1 Tax=Streptomyces sp. NPDC091209 TaxID=3365974 RepID=UPI0038225683
MEPAITVGLDGSPESLAAAHWAAEEAQRRQLTLRLLHAWPLLVPEPARLPAEVDQNYWAKRIVDNALSELQARYPGLSVVGELVADDAQQALLKAAAESEMIVLGSRGLGYVESYFLGDISMPVVARAEHAAVLIRAEARGASPQPTPRTAAPVVAALQLHGPCEDVLSFAFVTAAVWSAPLRVVHGRSLPVHAHAPWGFDHGVAEEITQEAREQMHQALRGWREKFPGVEVTDVVRLESPAKAVLREAESAGLLAVGRRRHHPAPTGRLGPVAQAAVHHARCAVAVVPHD